MSPHVFGTMPKLARAEHILLFLPVVRGLKRSHVPRRTPETSKKYENDEYEPVLGWSTENVGNCSRADSLNRRNKPVRNGRGYRFVNQLLALQVAASLERAGGS